MRGLATCEVCGAVVCGVPAKESGATTRPGYYVCRHRTHPPEGRARCKAAPYVQQEMADVELEQTTLARLVELRNLLAAGPERQAPVPDFDGKRLAIAARRKRLVQAVAAGKLGLDDIDSLVAELDADLADVETAAAEYAARTSAGSAEARRATLGFVDVVSQAWAGLLPAERRSVIAVLAERIVMGVNRKVAVTWRDASELASSVGAVGARAELGAGLADAACARAVEAPADAPPRPRTRAARRPPLAARRAA